MFVLAVVLLILGMGFTQAQDTNLLTVDACAPAHPFPHFWEQVFGFGRAELVLRSSFRQDLDQMKQATDIQYLRFHAILGDELGVYDEDAHGQAIYNFSYVDQVYDALQEAGVRPFVEIGFMPRKLAAKDMPHPFWYKPNVSPPKDWAKWDGLMTEFIKHLVARYGEDEVNRWYFEVWNEPNLDFWGGKPKQATYWKLYDHTARALKAVCPQLRVGGPATAQAAWVDAFIRHCADEHVPADFVSTHVYGNDPVSEVLGTKEAIPRDEMVERAVQRVARELQESPMPRLPLIWTEYNASYLNEPSVTDSTFMGPWLANTVRQCDGMVKFLSYWTISDVFDEQGVVRTPSYGGYGLFAVGGIPKPAFNAFKLLHRLGTERLALDSKSALLTRKSDGKLVLAVWNYAPSEKPGNPRCLRIHFSNVAADRARISRLDADHGDMRPAYRAMGSPRYPTQLQLQKLKSAAALGDPELSRLRDSELTLTLPTYGLAIIELD